MENKIIVFLILSLSLAGTSFCADAQSRRKTDVSLKTSQYISNIYAALNSATADVKIRALEIISYEPSKFSATKVKPLLQDKDNDVKIKSAVALARMKDTSGLPYLRNLATTKATLPATPTVAERLKYFSTQNLRIKAILALGEVRDSASAAILLELTKDADARIVDSAWISLAKLGNKKGVDIFISGLESQERTVRAKSADVLGELGVSDAVYQMRERLNDWDKDVKVSAINGLGKLKDTQSIPKFKDFLLTKKDQSIREAAALSLGRVGNKDNIEFLKKFIRDKNGVVRLAVCEALAMLGDYSGKDFILLSARKAAEKEIRYRAIRALAYFPLEKNDIDVLAEFAKDSDELLAVEASAVLLKFGD